MAVIRADMDIRIVTFFGNTRQLLLRPIVNEEVISYQMPAFSSHSMPGYFAECKIISVFRTYRHGYRDYNT